MVHLYDSTKVDIANITIDNGLNVLPNVNVRYVLTIPFLNRTNGISVTIILMNPAEADLNVSDRTVNKLIDFFYSYTLNEQNVKEIIIGNVLPIYAQRPQDALLKIKSLHSANILEKIQEINKDKVLSILHKADMVVLAWGKPEVKTISNLFYYNQVFKVVEIISTLEKDIYVFNVKNAISTFTEHGDPRHAGRSVTLNGLIKVRIESLFGLH